MAAMLQQQYVVQETEPRDWAACDVKLLDMLRSLMSYLGNLCQITAAMPLI